MHWRVFFIGTLYGERNSLPRADLTRPRTARTSPTMAPSPLAKGGDFWLLLITIAAFELFDSGLADGIPEGQEGSVGGFGADAKV